jgi:hypothetical protein
MKYTRTPIFSFQSNEASVLNIYYTYIFLYLFCRTRIACRKVYSTHLCLGLTRIALAFLKNLRSIWVVIIGLELLSLACPGLGLVKVTYRAGGGDE